MPIRNSARRSWLTLLGVMFASGCSGGDHAGRLRSAQLELEYDALRDRMTMFGPAGGPNLLHVQSLDLLPAADGAYTFFGGMYSWISPQGAWLDETGAPRDWPPDPAMDRGPIAITHQVDRRLVARGPITRCGLIEQKWFELVPDRHVALLDHRLFNPTTEKILGGVWINTAVKPGAVIAVRDGASEGFRIAGGDAANQLWARATSSSDGWLLIHTRGVQWDDLGTDWFKFFASGAPTIAIWTDGWWLLRQARTTDQLASLATYHEAPVEVYVNYGLQLFEAELLGPIEAIPPGGTVQHLERWTVVRAAEPDTALLDALPIN